MTAAELLGVLIVAVEEHRDTQGNEAGCTTGAELELWGVLERVKDAPLTIDEAALVYGAATRARVTGASAALAP